MLITSPVNGTVLLNGRDVLNRTDQMAADIEALSAALGVLNSEMAAKTSEISDLRARLSALESRHYKLSTGKITFTEGTWQTLNGSEALESGTYVFYVQPLGYEHGARSRYTLAPSEPFPWYSGTVGTGWISGTEIYDIPVRGGPPLRMTGGQVDTWFFRLNFVLGQPLAFQYTVNIGGSDTRSVTDINIDFFFTKIAG